MTRIVDDDGGCKSMAGRTECGCGNCKVTVGLRENDAAVD